MINSDCIRLLYYIYIYIFLFTNVNANLLLINDSIDPDCSHPVIILYYIFLFTHVNANLVLFITSPLKCYRFIFPEICFVRSNWN